MSARPHLPRSCCVMFPPPFHPPAHTTTTILVIGNIVVPGRSWQVRAARQDGAIPNQVARPRTISFVVVFKMVAARTTQRCYVPQPKTHVCIWSYRQAFLSIVHVHPMRTMQARARLGRACAWLWPRTAPFLVVIAPRCAHACCEYERPVYFHITRRGVSQRCCPQRASVPGSAVWLAFTECLALTDYAVLRAGSEQRRPHSESHGQHARTPMGTHCREAARHYRNRSCCCHQRFGWHHRHNDGNRGRYRMQGHRVTSAIAVSVS